MEKQKRWQFFLILSVVILTVYNILPTVFYYTKPLKKPIQQEQALQIATDIGKRINTLEQESVEWTSSFCTLLHLTPLSLSLDPDNKQLIKLSFKSIEEANLFRKFLPRAGSLIPFAPSQLSLYENDLASKTVTLQRRIPLHFQEENLNTYFQYGTKRDANGQPTELYKGLISDRVIHLGSTLAGTSEPALYIQASLAHLEDPQGQQFLLTVAQNLVSFTKTFDENSSLAKRYFANFSQCDETDKAAFIKNFIHALESAKNSLRLERIALNQEKEELALDPIKQQRLDIVVSQETSLGSAEAIVRRNEKSFASGSMPWGYAAIGQQLSSTKGAENIQTLSLKDHHPFIEQLQIDWTAEKIVFKLYGDVLKAKEAAIKTTTKDQIDQFIYNELATLSRQAGEQIKPFQNQFEIALSALPGSSSFLALRLFNIAQAETKQLAQHLQTSWIPQHPDLKRDVFPILDFDAYQSLPLSQKKMGLLVYAPALYNKMPPKGFKMNSVYVIAKGVDKILERFSTQDAQSEEATQFFEDFNKLRTLMQNNGFFGYSASAWGTAPEFAGDFIFEGEGYYQTVLKATRENFTVHGTQRYAVLEFTDMAQRILTANKIEDEMHEELLKWRDDYHMAQVDLRGTSKYDVPKPTKNVLWDNFILSFTKYFRGDERKILHWGLDMSGGKTVQIELRDSNNRVVTNDTDLKQGISELYNRVNKMGVSEVTIRQEGNTISLDFPGSQTLSATELVRASSMYFHVVNEKFMTNPQLKEATNQFLQEVWNEAVITNRKTIEEINTIAFKHLYGNTLGAETIQPRTPSAKLLHESGLKLANPQESFATPSFDDTFSKITLWRGEDFTEWHGQTHPLLLVFHNYALEGSNLENVHSSYDPSKGNFLVFEVKASQSAKDGIKFYPRDDLFAWTSQFSKEKIGGTPLEAFSQGLGWRMAVILNGSVVTAPALESPLKESASITGSFTQREVNRLEADLKAGSLSFTPKILSEKSVSPELGTQERIQGIIATVLSLFLVIVTMIVYYRFGGVVASIAVLFNLLMLWATLQNIGATLSLAGIAGIVLTVAMAVDANVLVFERIREEFALTGRIASAVQIGYRKAFSAILDSNITTLIAALVLLNFDAGPIKGFAVTLIIGIISSLFSALFMTRFFFLRWVQDVNHKELKMANWFHLSKPFDFLKFTKPTVLVSACVIVLGCALFVTNKQAILGMDFTGGYALSVQLPELPQENYRQHVEKALTLQGLSSQDFQVRELNPQSCVRIFLSRHLEEQGLPFYGLEPPANTQDLSYGYQSNPKITWVVTALEKSGLSLSPTALAELDQNWTAVSGQMSETMRLNALIGVVIALVCILIYITLRFEFHYALSATLCLAHDVLFCVGFLALLNKLGVPLQIDLHTVAALMTIVGYSLNDTIIIFDRIREDIRLNRKMGLKEVINHALNVTLSRTLMTSGITLLVLLPLIFLGGSTLFGFALVMATGVVFGTLSSLFIAAPLMEYFHRREIGKREKLALNGD